MRLLETDICSPEIWPLPLSRFFSGYLLTEWVRAYVNESELGKIKPGQEAFVTIDSFPDKKIPGQVGFISSVAEFTPKTVQTPDLRTNLVYEVRVNVDDKDNVLRLGMPATVSFQR